MRARDLSAMRIAITDAEKDGRRMDPETFSIVVDTLVKAGMEDEAVHLFRGLEHQRLLPGFGEFRISRNTLEEPGRVLSILSTSSEFSIGHVSHLFKLIFSVVTSYVLLSEGKISKK